MVRKILISGGGRRYGAPCLFVLAAAAVSLIPGALPTLRWDRAAVEAGELWRVPTGHLVHATPEHLVWDLAATLALGLAVSARSPRLFLRTVGLAAVAIPLGVHLFLPGIATYCGLSGIASALFAAFAAGLLADAVRDRSAGGFAVAALLAAAFLAKVLYEALTGAAVFADLGSAAVVPVPLAHLVGAAAGLAGALSPAGKRALLDRPTRGAGGPLPACRS